MYKATGLRLRPDSPVQVEFADACRLTGYISTHEYEKILLSLMGHSLYARESELDQGYFTLPDGSRAGVCGKYASHGPRSVSEISSVYLRIAREVKGCAEALIGRIEKSGGTLIISQPGKGKTTLLRDIARSLSCKKSKVCIIDERGELAAYNNGHVNKDIGPCTDVISGLKKHVAVPMAVRTCAPEIIVTDEIGDEHDAEALADAVRCGVKIVASAHGSDYAALSSRKTFSDIIESEIFDLFISLGPGIGETKEIIDLKVR